MSENDNVINFHEYKTSRESLKYPETVFYEDDELLSYSGVTGHSLEEDYTNLLEQLGLFFYLYSEKENPDIFYILGEILFSSVFEMIGEKNELTEKVEKIKSMFNLEQLKEEIYFHNEI